MEKNEKRRRVRNMKMTIIFVLLFLLLFSFVLNIVLLIKVQRLDKRIKELYSLQPKCSVEWRIS